jgi:hypothetical protein
MAPYSKTQISSLGSYTWPEQTYSGECRKGEIHVQLIFAVCRSAATIGGTR